MEFGKFVLLGVSAARRDTLTTCPQSTGGAAAACHVVLRCETRITSGEMGREENAIAEAMSAYILKLVRLKSAGCFS